MILMYLDFKKYLNEIKPNLKDCLDCGSLNISIEPSIHLTEEWLNTKQSLHKEIFKSDYMVGCHIHNLIMAIESKDAMGFIVRVDGKAVGTIDVEEVNNVVYLLNLGLIDEYRGKGISKVLLTSCIEYVIKDHLNSYEGLYLTVNKDNVLARNLYESVGFVPKNCKKP